MPDYIDREAANLALAEQGFDWDKAKQALASVPAADVVPVVHGTWMHYGCDDEIVTCSRCGYEAYAEAFYVREGTHCPMCGAKMDRGAKDEVD